MGKASSGKKVARAAATGGGARTSRGGSGGPWKWYAVIALVAALGVVLLVTSRSERQEEISSIGPPRPGDHWHVAYGINVCGAFQPPLSVERDPQGIHTHMAEGGGDGIIHIHPFTSQAAGDKATLGKFTEAAGLGLEDGSLTLPDGDVYADGDECHGEESVLRVKYDDEIFTENLADINFTADRGQLTIFFGPADAEIPPPPSVPNLDNLSDVPPEEQQNAPIQIPSDPEATPPPPEGEAPPAEGEPAPEGQPPPESQPPADGSTEPTGSDPTSAP